jgi:adenylate kinase family enzyme
MFMIWLQFWLCRPKMIFIVGRSGWGKTTRAAEFGEQGYVVRSTDRIVDKYWGKGNWPDPKIYRNCESGKLKPVQETFIEHIVDEINEIRSADPTASIVIEGCLYFILLNALIERVRPDEVIFMEHASLESFTNAVIQRAARDINSNFEEENNLGKLFWNRDGHPKEPAIAEYQKSDPTDPTGNKKLGMNSPVFREFVSTYTTSVMSTSLEQTRRDFFGWNDEANTYRIAFRTETINVPSL